MHQLVDTKSKDKHSNVMHFVVKTMQEHYPDCLDFASEFTALQKASTGMSLFSHSIMTL